MKEHKAMYLAEANGRIRGVFSTREAAEETRADNIREIVPVQLDGSPDYSGWVALAEGEWTSVSMTVRGVQSETARLGPVWGVNVQSAVAGLFGPGFDRRNVELTRLLVIRIGRNYGACPPPDLKQDDLLGSIPWHIENARGLPEEIRRGDYISAWQERIAEQRLRQQKADSPQLALLTEHLMQAACDRAPGNGGFCGTYLSNVERRLEPRILRAFSLWEMRLLTVLLGLAEDPKARRALDSGDVTAARQEELLLQISALTPTVRRTMGRRRTANRSEEKWLHDLLYPDEQPEDASGQEA